VDLITTVGTHHAESGKPVVREFAVESKGILLDGHNHVGDPGAIHVDLTVIGVVPDARRLGSE
jgi:hypothetical protein